MRVQAGETADQVIYATDAGGDPLTFSKGLGPDYVGVSTLDAGAGTATGHIHLAPPPSIEIGVVTASVIASDGVLSAEESFTIVSVDNPPVLLQPEDMQLEAGRTADQALTATDADNDALTFSLARGPWFVTVSTTGPGTGNVHLAPVVADSGFYRVTVSAGDGVAVDHKTFTVTIPAGTTPVLTQPNDMTVQAGQTVSQTIAATDLDGQALSFFKAEGPRYMGVESGYRGSPYGRIVLAPELRDSPTPEGGGPFHIPASVGVSDGIRSDVKSFTIHVTFPLNHAPVLEHPADQTVTEGDFLEVYLSHSDPDPELVWITVAGPDFIEVFAPYGGPSSLWMRPGYTDAGTYTVVVRATDSRGLFDEKSFHVTVENRNAPPSIDRVDDFISFVGGTTERMIQARDVDGDPLTFYKTDGPAFFDISTVDPGTGVATGMIRLKPTADDLGSHAAMFRVSDGTRAAFQRVAIGVYAPGRPVFREIRSTCLLVGVAESLLVRAEDAEGDRLTFSFSGLPSYGSFVDHGDGTAILTLRPTGVVPPSLITVTVSDGASSWSQTLAVWLCWGGFEYDGRPVAVIEGPNGGIAGEMVYFDGSRSYDPDGKPLRLAWNFGDGTVGLGKIPGHVYATPGQYGVTLYAADSMYVGIASMLVAVAGPSAAPKKRTAIRLGAGAPMFCTQFEPVSFPYGTVDVRMTGLTMKSVGTGSVDQIDGTAATGSTAWLNLADQNGNGVPEIDACFAKDDLRKLFSDVKVETQLPAQIEGRTLSGVTLRAVIGLTVVPAEAPLVATVSPNPLNPTATFSFRTLRAGPLRVVLFDVSGRRVRTLLDQAAAPAGFHDLLFDGKGDRGERLGSGVYYYQIDALDGRGGGRLVILR